VLVPLDEVVELAALGAQGGLELRRDGVEVETEKRLDPFVELRRTEVVFGPVLGRRG
jgi:hypothetical protein